MNSGIYLLKFKNNSTYVGKAIDIEKTVSKYITDFQNGKASNKLQDTYNKNGPPKLSILVKCHTDHLDMLETLFICKYQPQLNAYGGITSKVPELDVILANKDLILKSTVDHINTIVHLKNNTYPDKRIDSLKEDIEELKEELEEADIRAAKWEWEAKRPWWKRLLGMD